MKRFSIVVLLILTSFVVGVGVTYVATSTVWVSDMANQPSIKAQEMPFERPPGAVPVGPTEMNLAAHQSKPTSGSPKQETTSPKDDHGGASATPMDQHGGAAPAGADHHGGAAPSPQGHHGGAAPAGADHHGGASPTPMDHHGGAAPAGPDHHGGASPAPQGHHGAAAPAGPDNHGGMAGMAMEHGPESVNPIEPTVASIKQGGSLFGVYCAVCHGAKGQGGMPIATKYPKIPKFTLSLLQQTPDSHMFSMLTSGHGPMPGYAEALSSSDRWDVINYLRNVQKEL